MSKRETRKDMHFKARDRRRQKSWEQEDARELRVRQNHRRARTLRYR